MPLRAQVERTGQSGIALVLVLVFALAMSAVGASMVVLARTETLASQSYRLMTQSRYAAESGVHKAVHHLLNSYIPPGGAGDPVGAYDATVSPVRFNGAPVVLSADRKSTRLNSSHVSESRMPSSA